MRSSLGRLCVRQPSVPKHYNYFRDYDPGVGRYIESDPLGLLTGANTYHYSSSSPLGRSDFFGLKDCGTDNFWGKHVIPDNPF